MDEMDGEEAIRRGWLRWLGIGTGTLGLVLVALWTQRAPIADNLLTRELNRRDILARYRLVDIGLRTQRIEKLVLGDPADPDLTARWVEVDIALTGLTPGIAAIRAGGVRMRGRLHEGVLTLGELDKLRDSQSTAPFSLPDIRLALADARMRLATDAGIVGLALDGSGHLHSGFRGRLAAAMPQAGFAGCGVARATALLDVAIEAERPRFAGPVKAQALACGNRAIALAQPAGQVDVTLGKALDRWTGRMTLNGEALKAQGVVAARPSATVDFDGTTARTGGRLRLNAQAMGGAGALAQDLGVDARWSVATGKMLDAQAQGQLTANRLHGGGRDPLAGLRASTAGTPIGPLAARLADAVRAAGNDNRLRARFAVAQRGSGGSLVLTDAALSARSGARIGLAPDSRLSLSWPGARSRPVDWALDGSVTTDGGGLPRTALRLARRPGGGFGGQMFIDPYAAGDARLALEAIRFTAGAGGETRFTTALRLDGPLEGGALRGLLMPLYGRIGADGSLAINQRCAPLAVQSASYGGFALGRTRQTLCPVEGGALLSYGAGGLRGGAQIRDLALRGRSGESPMALSADSARVTLGQPGFALANALFSVGPRDAPVRLSAASITGRAAGQGQNDRGLGGRGLGGRLEGASARIGSVPLDISEAQGDWSFVRGSLDVKGSLLVDDTASPARFNRLASQDFALTMRDGRITANGSLTAPRNGARVALIDIRHDLGNGQGQADLKVPGLVFDSTLQPKEVTELAKGIIDNVMATVTGEGRIRWRGDGVTSDGHFRTDNANLAAAFGPVEGLSGDIRFTDLLGLVTAPGQEVRLKTVNPGVAVRDGVVHYRLEPGQKVHVEGGEWPFSGGQLVLLPTTLDFSAAVDRYLTFRVIGMDAGAFIQAMELDNISATGTFDGIMPLIFDADGGRIAGGVLVARQQGLPALLMPEGVLPTIPCDPVRQSGTLSYVGPVSNEQLGAMGKLAFDALKNLQYKCLTILMDGALDGEMVTNVVFNGVNRGQIGSAPASIARNFVGLPFLFNVRVEAPFRGLLGTAQSFVDPSQLIRNSLGDDYQEKLRQQSVKQGLAVQPVESDTIPNREPK
jgi:translocation and assembly module TamB